jgi:tetratricopeptide (TPR) repeat protein
LLRYIINLNVEQLQKLRSTLTETEDRFLAAYTPAPIAIPRDEHNFDPAYLRGLGETALEQMQTEDGGETDPADAAAAIPYYQAALSIEPFNGNDYAGLAALYLYMQEPEEAMRWLNEGLMIDPENEPLNKLLEAAKGVMGS